MIVPIVWTTQSVPTVQITIGGILYTARMLYNFYGSRYYLSLESNSIVRLFRPLIGSPEDADIDLALGLPGKLVYRTSKSQLESDS